MFLGLTGGRARGYGVVGACMDAEDKVDKVARRENKNRVRARVELAYWGVVDCAVRRREA
jgi:hypothetical protein